MFREGIPMGRIMALTCKEFGVSEEAVKRASRARPLMLPRVAFSYVAFSEGHKLKDIATAIGRSNHTTVLNQIENYNEQYFAEHWEKAESVRRGVRLFRDGVDAMSGTEDDKER